MFWATIYDYISPTGETFYMPGEKRLQILDATVRDEINKASNFTFSIYPDHPAYNRFVKFKSTVEVFRDGVPVFRGRVLSDSVDTFNRRTVTCESELAYFADSVVRPYEFTEAQGGVREYLSFLVASHNAQVSAERRFNVGEVTVSEPGESFYRSSGTYPDTLAEMASKLAGEIGGIFVVSRGSSGRPVINYLEDIGIRSRQPLRLSENVLSVMLERSGEDIATAVIPLGAVIEEEYEADFTPIIPSPQSDETGPVPETYTEYSDGMEPSPEIVDAVRAEPPRLTISTVTQDGSDFLYNQNAVDRFGWIFRTVVFDDVTDANALLQLGIRELGKNLEKVSSLTVTAIDLSQTGQAVDDFNFLEYVDIELPENGIQGRLLVIKKTTDLMRPQNNTITVGSDWGRFTYNAVDQGERIESIVTDMGNREEISNIFNTIRMISSSMQQLADSITFTVSENFISQDQFAEYQNEVSTMFQQTADSFLFQFNTINNTITSNEQGNEARFDEITNYIQFVDGEIWIGQLGQEFQLRIGLDKISFLDSNAEVAYISNNRLFITDAYMTNKLQIGNFGFIPRESGNLSFGRIT